MENDKILYQKFLEGDKSAFEELVVAHKDHLIFFLRRYCKEFSICEDIAQEVFAYIYVYKDKYDSKYAFKTYLYTLAKNKAVDYLRKQSRQISHANIADHTHVQVASINDTGDLLAKVVRDENARLVHGCLRKLHIDYQTCIHLVDFEELSYKEAGIVMNKSMPQFKVLLFRARKALKKQLEKEGYIHEG